MMISSTRRFGVPAALAVTSCLIGCDGDSHDTAPQPLSTMVASDPGLRSDIAKLRREIEEEKRRGDTLAESLNALRAQLPDTSPQAIRRRILNPNVGVVHRHSYCSGTLVASRCFPEDTSQPSKWEGLALTSLHVLGADAVLVENSETGWQAPAGLESALDLHVAVFDSKGVEHKTPARIVGVDGDTGLMLLQFESQQPLRDVARVAAKEPPPGAFVVTVGNHGGIIGYFSSGYYQRCTAATSVLPDVPERQFTAAMTSSPAAPGISGGGVHAWTDQGWVLCGVHHGNKRAATEVAFKIAKDGSTTHEYYSGVGMTSLPHMSLLTVGVEDFLARVAPPWAARPEDRDWTEARLIELSEQISRLQDPRRRREGGARTTLEREKPDERK